MKKNDDFDEKKMTKFLISALFSPFEYFVHIVVLKIKTLLCVKKQSSLSLSLE